MNKESNLYTIIYSTVLVIAVAAILAFVSLSLKDKQQRNIDMETKTNILKSVNLAPDVETAPNRFEYIDERYNKYITASYLVNADGEKIEGEAFKVDLKGQFDVMRLSKTDITKLTLPVFECTLDSGEKVYIFSIYGAGLWGPIWGYISLKSDLNTVYGANFGHKGETPGLGAEIATDQFSGQFLGKEIFNNGAFCSIAVVKGGAEKGNSHQVDAISGGTITSNALQETISSWFNYYLPFIKKEVKDEEGNL